MADAPNIPAKPKYNLLIIFLNILFIVYAIISINHLIKKPFLPENYNTAFPYSINANKIENAEEAEFFISGMKIGNEINVLDYHSGVSATLRLVPFYSSSFILMDGLIISLIFLVGAMVYYKKPKDRASTIFHFASMAVAADIIGTKTLYVVTPSPIGYSLSLIFFLIYTIVPVIFLHLTYVFPSDKWVKHKKAINSLYVFGVLLAILNAAVYLEAARMNSFESYRISAEISKYQNGFVFVIILLGVINFIRSYNNASAISEKKKIRWILYGLSIGPTPFIFFWVLPIALGYSPIIPEIWFKLFILVIPITFAISILKYHILDVDVVINRSSVYAIVIGLGLITYLGIIGFTAKVITVFSTKTSLIVSAITAASLALLFEPLRRYVQKIVDKYFFRVQYDFRKTQQKFIEEIKGCLNIQNLAELLVSRIDELLPTERMGFFKYNNQKHLQLLAHHHFEMLERHSLRLEADKLNFHFNLPIAINNKIEAGIPHETPDEQIFLRWGIVLVFPLLSERREIIGFLTLGSKKSGARYSREDVDLLNTIITQSVLTIERIELQQKLLLEQAETQRLEELNKLKSYFVSSVSHDLKTPLTSIKMFAELLRNGNNVSKSDAAEYLEIIEGESERLTRLINNVLDFSRIERGVKEYHFTDIELNSLVRHVLKTMQYQFKIEKCTVRTSFCSTECYLNADKDAVTEALVNLISNSIKYSYDTKEITVSTFRMNGSVALRIEDKGIGIPEHDIAHIFEPFYRAKEGNSSGTGGAGLGLAIVKHIIEAHNGKISVQSKPGKGSIFTLLFPLSIEE